MQSKPKKLLRISGRTIGGVVAALVCLLCGFLGEVYLMHFCEVENDAFPISWTILTLCVAALLGLSVALWSRRLTVISLLFVAAWGIDGIIWYVASNIAT